MALSARPAPRQQLDAGVLQVLAVLQAIGLTLALLLAGLTFLYWILPSLGSVMPPFFRFMRANNSFLGILCGTGLLLQQPRHTCIAERCGASLGAFATGFASLLLACDFGWIGPGINTLFAADPASLIPGRVSPEAAITYMLLGLTIATLRVRTRPLAYLADLATFALCLLMAFFLATYILGVSHLIIPNPKNPFALQTYILLTVFTGVATTRRAEFGVFAVLLSRGVGGQFVRIAAPLAFLLPFAFTLGDVSLRSAGALPDTVATARMTSLVSIVAFCLVVALAAWTDRLESRMEQAIVRDDLTGLNNRRGFLYRADMALRLAQRDGDAFFVVLVDLDNLRAVNRERGHAIGSSYLATMARLLDQTHAPTAILGRVRGDEFAVAARGDASLCLEFLSQLQAAADVARTPTGEVFAIGYTVGTAFTRHSQSASLSKIMHLADRQMNEGKQLKLAGRNELRSPSTTRCHFPAGPPPNSLSPPSPDFHIPHRPSS